MGLISFDLVVIVVGMPPGRGSGVSNVDGV